MDTDVGQQVAVVTFHCKEKSSLEKMVGRCVQHGSSTLHIQRVNMLANVSLLG